MALNRREKILAAATLAVAAIVGGRLALGGLSGSGTLDQQTTLQAEIDKKKARVQRGEKAAKLLAEWERRSLPRDHELARSLYQNWLLKVVDEVGIRAARVDTGEGRPHRNVYFMHPFTVRGQAGLAELTRFLHQFYSAGHLHQIRHVAIKPGNDNKTLDVLVSIEALSLPGADRADRLSSVPGNRLAAASLDDYLKAIAGRNPLAPYAPAPAAAPETPPPAAPEPPKFDASRFAYLTGIVQNGGKPQAWFVSRTTDQSFRLSVGDRFEVGPLVGKVLAIGQRDVEFEVDSRRYKVALGMNLAEAMAQATAAAP